MNLLKRSLFRAFVSGIRLYQRLFLDLRLTREGYIPAGPKIFVTNHISTTDPYWVLPLFGEPVHIIIGPGYHSKLMGRVYDWFEQINAMPAHRHTVVEKAVAYLQRGESVYTAPEGDLQTPGRLGRFFPGVGRIYRRSRAPIIPLGLHAPCHAIREYPNLDLVVDGRRYRTVVVMRGPFHVNIGRPFSPAVREDLDEDADALRIADDVRGQISRLIEEVRTVGE